MEGFHLGCPGQDCKVWQLGPCSMRVGSSRLKMSASCGSSLSSATASCVSFSELLYQPSLSDLICKVEAERDVRVQKTCHLLSAWHV